MFKRVKESRVYEHIVDQIYQAILRGELKPMDKLPSENELCGLFGVSRVTVREAIRYLEQLGVLEIRQGSTGGAFVKRVDLEDIAIQMGKVLRMANVTFMHLAEARASLEHMIIRELIPAKIIPDLAAALVKNIENASVYYRARDDRNRVLANFKFHSLIAKATGNPIIILMHRIIVELSYGFFENVQSTPSIGENTLDHHRHIVALLTQGHIAAAADACANHIRHVSGGIVEKSSQQSAFAKKTHC